MVILCYCNQNFKDPFIKKQKHGQMQNVFYTNVLESSTHTYTHISFSHIMIHT